MNLVPIVNSVLTVRVHRSRQGVQDRTVAAQKVILRTLDSWALYSTRGDDRIGSAVRSLTLHWYLCGTLKNRVTESRFFVLLEEGTVITIMNRHKLDEES